VIAHAITATADVTLHTTRVASLPPRVNGLSLDVLFSPTPPSLLPSFPLSPTSRVVSPSRSPSPSPAPSLSLSLLPPSSLTRTLPTTHPSPDLSPLHRPTVPVVPQLQSCLRHGRQW